MKSACQVDRIFRCILFVASGAVLLLVLGSVVLMTQSVRQRDAHHLQGLMGLLAAQSEAILMFEDADSARDLLAMLDQTDVVGVVELHRASGALLARHELKAAESEGRSLTWLLSMLTLERAIQVDGRGYGRIIFKGGYGKSREALWVLYRNIAVLGVSVMGLVFVLGRRLARRLNAPLLSLQRQFQIASREPAHRLEALPDAAPEWQTIVQIGNGLLADLEQCRRERYESDAVLLHLGTQDPLTGLADRVTFERHRLAAIRQARQQSSRLGMLYLEVEDFRRIEADLKPEAAAQLLHEIVTRLRRELPGDAVMTRRDAGQFMLLLAPPVLEWVDERARRLREALEAPYQLDADTVILRVGIGWAVYPDTVETPDALTWAADAIMYGRRVAHPSDQSEPEGHR